MDRRDGLSLSRVEFRGDRLAKIIAPRQGHLRRSMRLLTHHSARAKSGDAQATLFVEGYDTQEAYQLSPLELVSFAG